MAVELEIFAPSPATALHHDGVLTNQQLQVLDLMGLTQSVYTLLP